MAKATTRIPEIIEQHEASLLQEWVAEQRKSDTRGMRKESELREDCREFVSLIKSPLKKGKIDDTESPEWNESRDFLAQLSRRCSAQGLSPSETATFVFSFKGPLFAHLRQEYARDPEALADEILRASKLFDRLGLITTEVYMKGREEVIGRQQEDMLELSTPVMTLWEGILAIPVIGTLDSARSQTVMESLLTRIVQEGAEIAIIDITGVPTVDTLTAQHLLKTVTAARLMGADCIISGIRPQIAQTIVHLGVDLNMVVTKASLAGAFRLAMDRMKLKVVRDGNVKPSGQG